jgi:hypothetical protein
MNSSSSTDNLIAALGQSSRVCQVDLLSLANWQLENVMAAMQVPFPELTDLRLCSISETPPVIPDSFLGGSAPGLEHFDLNGIPFPALPILVSSASHLATLNLINIPHSGYISPEAMVTLLTALSSLGHLSLEFESPRSRPGWESRSLPPPQRSIILSALLEFQFKGVTEYLEELVTPIDTPQLGRIDVAFFNQIDFDTPRLAQFINRTPRLRARNAQVKFDDDFAHVGFPPGGETLGIAISCREPDWQLTSVAQVCNTFLHPVSAVEDLYIDHEYWQLVWNNDVIENWLELFVPFTAVEKLYLSRVFAQGIAATLQELVGDRILEVLPRLRNIFVEGLESLEPFQETVEQFLARRRRSGHPIAISVWNRR